MARTSGERERKAAIEAQTAATEATTATMEDVLAKLEDIETLQTAANALLTDIETNTGA